MSEDNRWRYILDIIFALLKSLIPELVAYLKSDRFGKRFRSLLDKILSIVEWLLSKWRVFVLCLVVIVLGAMTYDAFTDWRIIAFSLTCYLAGALIWIFARNRPVSLGKRNPSKSWERFFPVRLSPDVGNSYLRNRFIDPPCGDSLLGSAQFQLGRDSLMFDTSGQLRYYLPRDDGGEEVELRLPEPQSRVKTAHFLINSSNSKGIYAGKSIGKIRLIFSDAPPMVVKLVLGENIREWCPGHPGKYVRETSSPMVMNVWKGLSKDGAPAVMDCLQIPVFDCMKDCTLEQIVFVHKSPKEPSDRLGTHYSVFGVSLEMRQNAQD